MCIPERQEASEIFYRDILKANFKSESMDIPHALPRALFEDPQVPKYDLAAAVLKHVLDRPDLKPMDLDWENHGKLIEFP